MWRLLLEQTAEEIERTKQFSAEVIELMKHTPDCTMSFNKFIPAYHHHFGKQCRVADYGFTKLIELFEAIPDILEVSICLWLRFLHLLTWHSTHIDTFYSLYVIVTRNLWLRTCTGWLEEFKHCDHGSIVLSPNLGLKIDL